MADKSGIALTKVGLEIDDDSFRRFKESLLNIPKAFQEELDRVSGIAWDGFKDYSRDTSKDVTKT